MDFTLWTWIRQGRNEHQNPQRILWNKWQQLVESQTLIKFFVIIITIKYRASFFTNAVTKDSIVSRPRSSQYVVNVLCVVNVLLPCEDLNGLFFFYPKHSSHFKTKDTYLFNGLKNWTLKIEESERLWPRVIVNLNWGEWNCTCGIQNSKCYLLNNKIHLHWPIVWHNVGTMLLSRISINFNRPWDTWINVEIIHNWFINILIENKIAQMTT